MTTPVVTFNELVSPLGEAEFRSILQCRQLTFSRGRDPHRYASLLNWELLIQLIERGDHPRGIDEFRLARESVSVPAARWLARNNVDGSIKVDKVKLDEFMNQGFSLVVDHIDRHVPQLASLCSDIKRESGERSYAAVVVSTGTGGAFRLHYDPEDLIIVQAEGTKRWRIFGPPVLKPVIGGPKATPPPEESPILDEVLQPGDFLFVPAGNWHHCQNGPGRSVHLGIFFVAPTSFDFMREMTSKLVAEDMFRMPLSRFGDPTQLSEYEHEVKRRLIDRVNRMSLRDFVSSWNAN